MPTRSHTRIIRRTLKRCGMCETFKLRSKFSKCARQKDGRSYRCKACDRVLYLAKHEENKAKRREYARAEDPAAMRARHKRWRDANSAKLRAMWNRWAATPQARVQVRLRSRLASAFNSYSKHGKVRQSKDYGIDWQAIIEYLGPCPGNRDDYHIDHIKPLSRFDFDDPKQVRKAFAPANHQWLLVADNLVKGARYADC